MKWERNIPCNNCETTNTTLYMTSDIIGWYDKQPLRLVQCTKCDLVYPDPRPSFSHIIKIQTSEWGRKVFYRKESKQSTWPNHTRDALLHVIKYKPDAETLFDVGFGCGTYMMLGRTLGLTCSGNEINRYSCEELTRRGFMVYEKPTVDLWIDKTYDIILCHDNIEHTYTPKEDIRWMYDHQEEGGIVNIRTLYLGCPRHIREKEHWNLFGSGHFHYYYPHVLVKMIQDRGYSILYQQEGNLINIIARK